ncbi:hypothetical protein OQA88_5363 [Cercophora sp. LCS_1]
MEVVGVVAAVPELLKLARRLGTAASRISSRREIGKTVSGLRAQLDLLSEVLEGIQQRDGGKAHSVLCGDRDRLTPILDETREELEGLTLLVDRVEDAKNNGPSFFKRARFVLTGCDSQLQTRSQRIDRSISLLQVYLAESAARAQHESRVFKLLKPSTSTTDFIPEKLEGTLEWVWTHDAFQRWTGAHTTLQTSGGPSTAPAGSVVSGSQDNVLTIYGVNGCGKSVMAASIADGLRKRGFTTLFFSFWSGNPHDTQSEVMFRTILWQLLGKIPQERRMRCLSRLLEIQADLKSTKVVVSEIQQLSIEHPSDIYLILDGIDESSDDWNDMRGGPLGQISKLLQSISQLRVLLAGRQASLRMALRKWPTRIELTRELVCDDMAKLIRSELSNCPNITDDKIKDHIRKELESKSAVMFLWVKLVFKELRLSFSQAEIHHTLSRLPDHLSQEYHRLFEIISKRLQGRQTNPSVGMQRAKDVLGLVIGAARPLKLHELRLLYAYSSPSGTGCYSENMITEEGIIDACGDIITTRGEFFYLGHSSLREFLVHQPGKPGKNDGSAAEYFRVDPQSCQKVMALACLRYLQDITWHVPDEDCLPKTLVSRYPLLCYATSYLTSHLLNSDMDTTEFLDHLETYIRSEQALCWLQFAVCMENDEDYQAMLPASFWDDMVQFWSSLDGFILPTSDEATSEPGPIWEGLLGHVVAHTVTDELPGPNKQHPTSYGSSGTSAASHMSTGHQQCQVVPQFEEVWGGRSLESGQLPAIVKHFVSQSKEINGQRLALILAPLKACISKSDAFLNPLDLISQALEKSLRGLSFLALIALAHSLMKTKEQLALKIGLLALDKVRGRGDLREAWAHGTVGDLESREDVRASHYKMSQEILQSRSRNPIIDLFWCSAGRCRVGCLLRMGKIAEGREVAMAVEEKLQVRAKDDTKQRSKPPPGQNTLRNRLYKTLEKHPWLVKARLHTAVNLSSHYSHDSMLHIDTERLLAPLIRDPSLRRRLGSEKVAQAMEFLGTAAHGLGKLDESATIWRELRSLLQSQGSGTISADIQDKVDNASMCLVASLLDGGKKHLAEKEIASIKSFSFLKDWTRTAAEKHVERFINLAHIMGQSSTSSKTRVTQFIRENMTHIEAVFVGDGRRQHEAWRFVASRFLSHGIFDEAESYIRRILAYTSRLGHEMDDGEEAHLLEALAFSIRCQGRQPKRQDPCDYYLAVLNRIESKRLGLTLRCWVGLGMHCAATGRRTEAMHAFQHVAFGYHSAMCGLYCIGDITQRLFQALAAIQANEVVKAICTLSLLIDAVQEGLVPYSCCDLRVAGYQDQVLLIAGHFYLASILDGCGMDPAMGDAQREGALWVIYDHFDYALDSMYVPAPGEADLCTIRWVQACVRYVEKRKAGEITSAVQPEEFPFEIFWVAQEEDDQDLLRQGSFGGRHLGSELSDYESESDEEGD